MIKSLLVICASACTIMVQSQAVTVNSENILFGTLDFEDADSVEIVLTNVLDETIEIEELRFFDFYVSSPFYVTNYPQEIAPLASASFYVVFKPIHNMSHNSELVIKTSGNRGAISIDLLGDCQYSNTYYDGTYDLLDSPLKDVFNDILAEGYQQYNYDVARDEMFMVIDNQQVNGQGSAQSRLTRAYIGTDAVGYTSRTDLFNNYSVNTEHTFPQGFFNSALPMVSDVHHLFGTDVNANSQRGNFAFGNVLSSTTYEQGGSKKGNDASGTVVFEPRDGHKGKAARAVLYFVLRYQNYGGFLTQNQETALRGWNDEFPSDAVDRKRNDDVFDFQNNRNPFSDYPQFADRILNFRSVGPQDRPNVGLFNISHEEIEFGMVASSEEIVPFNLVITNSGERFFNISNLELVNNTSGAFLFADEQMTSITVNKGESVNIPILFNSELSSGGFTAELQFTSTAFGQEEVNIPVSASAILGLQNADFSGVMLVPNPFGESLEFVDHTAVQYISSIEIYDLTGRLVIQIKGIENRISTGHLDAGIYHIVTNQKDGSRMVQKMVKQ